MSSEIQDKWQAKVFELSGSYGDEKPAVEWLIAELRKLIGHLESGEYPMMYGCSIPEDLSSEIMHEYRIALSHVWPG